MREYAHACSTECTTFWIAVEVAIVSFISNLVLQAIVAGRQQQAALAAEHALSSSKAAEDAARSVAQLQQQVAALQVICTMDYTTHTD